MMKKTIYLRKIGNYFFLFLQTGNTKLFFPAIIGKNGLSKNKKEGDNKTPIGNFKLLDGYFRADKINKDIIGKAKIKFNMINENSGWCCDILSENYNRYINYDDNPVNEKLYRTDDAYDIMINLDYNYQNPVKGDGSAIFFHLLKNDCQNNFLNAYTEGCIAISRKNMLFLLRLIDEDTYLSTDLIAS